MGGGREGGGREGGREGGWGEGGREGRKEGEGGKIHVLYMFSILLPLHVVKTV